jgi:hypothetical protein
MTSHPSSVRHTVILSLHTRLRHESDLFPSGYSAKNVYRLLPRTCDMPHLPDSPSFDHPNNVWINGEDEIILDWITVLV